MRMSKNSTSGLCASAACTAAAPSPTAGGDAQLGPGARQFGLQRLRQQRFVFGDQGGGFMRAAG
jgi:hypothetical protein